LAAQIDERFAVYGANLNLRHRVIFGGVGQNPQVKALQRGLDILVATPGRLLDLVAQGHIDLSHVEFFVLDEADRMLDMGFIRDIRRVLELLPNRRQNLLFSATMPKTIADLAGSFLNDAIMIDVTPEVVTVEKIRQQVYFVRKPDKRRLLVDILVEELVEKAIVFTRTKHGANRLVKQLDQSGILSVAIHGNKSQGARTKALAGFKDGKIPVLVATDLASRGIDVEGISHVFNYDLPNEAESYVHRIGRTARAGRRGVAYSFCDDSESGYLVGIEELTGQEIAIEIDHPYHFPAAIPTPGLKPGKMKNGKPTRNRSSHRNRKPSTGDNRRRSRNNKPRRR
jgi:ATP-dependent RNA helicase RhlE